MVKSQNSTRLFLIVATAIYSTDALLIRMAGSSKPVPFYRALFAAISLFIIFFSSKKNLIKSYREGGFFLFISIFMMSFTGVAFAYSVQLSGSALPLIYLSLSPLIASFISFIFLKEKPSRITFLSIIISILGIIIMNMDDSAKTSPHHHLLCMIPPTALAINFTVLRAHKNFDKKLICASGNLLSLLYSFFITKGNLSLDKASILPIAILGFIIVPFGQISMNGATKYLPSFEVALINSLEGIFGILWVYIILNEAPTNAQIIGGLIVFSAIFLNTIQTKLTRGK